MVDQAFGQAGGKADVAFGDGDEVIAQGVKPEFSLGGLADGRVHVMNVLKMARFGFAIGKNPFRFGASFTAFEHAGELLGNGEAKGFAGFGFFNG